MDQFHIQIAACVRKTVKSNFILSNYLRSYATLRYEGIEKFKTCFVQLRLSVSVVK